jgi:hypothetical protein
MLRFFLVVQLLDNLNYNNNARDQDVSGDPSDDEPPGRIAFTSDAMADPGQSLGGKKGEGDSPPATGLQRLLTGQYSPSPVEASSG